MGLANNKLGYGAVSKLMHWGMAALILTIVGIGLYMGDLPRGPEKGEVIGLHKSLGAIAGALVLVRILWHFISPTPTPVGKGWQLRLAHMGHHMLYLLMLVMPLSGILMSVTKGRSVEVFTWFTISPMATKFETLGDFAHDVHLIAAKLLYVMIAVHFVAALYHHFVVKDDTLKRMTHGAAS